MWRATAGLICLAVLGGCGGGGHGPSRSRAAPARPPASVLSRAPYMGVSCRVPNSIACDRVGLAVWLRRPALAVSATIDGRALRLDDRTWSGPPHTGERRMFAGFLQPAGLRSGPLRVIPDGGPSHWTGRHPVTATVRLVVRRRGGRSDWTTLRVPLSTGWG